MKNIAIVGKGPSVLKGYTELYDQFDTIVAVNWPVYTDEFKKYLPSRIDIMSATGIISPKVLKKYPMHRNYTQEQAENLKIKYILWLMSCRSSKRRNLKPNPDFVKTFNQYVDKSLMCDLTKKLYPSIPYLPIQYNMDYHKSNRKHYNLKDFDSSTGIRTLEYFSLQDGIQNIFFIGFDAYTKGGYYYYYPYDHLNYRDDCHDREKTIEYMQNLGKIFPDKNYHYISEIDFEDYENFNQVTDTKNFTLTKLKIGRY